MKPFISSLFIPEFNYTDDDQKRNVVISIKPTVRLLICRTGAFWSLVHQLGIRYYPE